MAIGKRKLKKVHSGRMAHVALVRKLRLFSLARDHEFRLNCAVNNSKHYRRVDVKVIESDHCPEPVMHRPYEIIMGQDSIDKRLVSPQGDHDGDWLSPGKPNATPPGQSPVVTHVTRKFSHGSVAGIHYSGTLRKDAKTAVVRDGNVIHVGAIRHLRQQQMDVDEVSANSTYTVALHDFADIRTGDCLAQSTLLS